MHKVGPEMSLPARPRIAVVGAGAVGGYYGARLAQHGHEVHFLLRGDYEAVRTSGWSIRSCAGDFTLPPERIALHRDVRSMPAADLVIVALKTTSEGQYQELLSPLVRENTAILSIQNGLGSDERLAELFGSERILGGLAFVCINRTGPGEIHHSSHGTIRMGEFAGRPGRRAESLAALLRESGIPCELLPDLRKGRWEKLVWNIPFNGLGAVMDLTTDKLIGSEQGRRLVGTLIAEVMSAGEGDGVRFDLSVDAMVAKQIGATREMGAYRSSMQIDRHEGRRLEVEAILGEPLRRAAKAGVPTPYLKTVYELARALDQRPM